MLLMNADRQSTAETGMIFPMMARRPSAREWQQLRRLRKKARLSQAKLADEIGLSQGMISQLEKGDSDYTRTHIESLSRFFQIDPAELVGDLSGNETLYEVLRDFPADERSRALEVLKALKRASVTN